ncbi:MAG: winged helix-turn-helix transcriptional regulator [Clostridia bacterium]|nr:winged helix-turn-helix transcriptional regulator [Clostridia bacterium]
MEVILNDIETCSFHMVHEDVVKEVEKNLPDDETVFELSELYKVFGDSTRIRILCVLKEHELCVCDIAKLLSMTDSAISHQLRVLRSARLIRSRRDGKTVFYSLADDHVISLIDTAIEHINEL